MKTTLFSIKSIFAFFLGWLFTACQQAPQNTGTFEVSSDHPAWSIHANIYEVNVRQYTPEGTFKAFANHLDRLQDMGVDILWFMPVTPIGELNRKGTLGSYYSVIDYTGINPEFGTIEDFKQLVDNIHERGMYVIIDWVANHTAWDHPWTITNPDFYTRNEQGEFVPPVDDWSDVIDLNYDNEELWDVMIGEMLYWVRDIGIDGFRCDVADMVPVAFWERARKELEAVNPVFMLAEAESPGLHHHAFDAAYGWSFHHIMNRVAQGENTVAAIDQYFFADNAGDFPEESYKMYFITNHDENSWAGTEFMRMGDGVEAFAVLTATIPGTLLIYSGQEAAFDRMLEFFEKDVIDWNDYSYHDFYKKLLGLKKRNQALWNGTAGGTMQRINTNHDDKVFAFTREKDNDKVLVILNLTAENVQLNFSGEVPDGTYTELFSGNGFDISKDTTLDMAPWGYYVFE
jgi:cyclomaltodextrinase / maltogenic alpha-amylase / neopullulanase